MLGNFIAQYSSITEASKINQVDASSICQVCKGKSSHAKWYIWKYA